MEISKVYIFIKRNVYNLSPHHSRQTFCRVKRLDMIKMIYLETENSFHLAQLCPHKNGFINCVDMVNWSLPEKQFES